MKEVKEAVSVEDSNWNQSLGKRVPQGRGRRRGMHHGRGKCFWLVVERLVQPRLQTLQDYQSLPASVPSFPQSRGCP